MSSKNSNGSNTHSCSSNNSSRNHILPVIPNVFALLLSCALYSLCRASKKGQHSTRCGKSPNVWAKYSASIQQSWICFGALSVVVYWPRPMPHFSCWPHVSLPTSLVRCQFCTHWYHKLLPLSVWYKDVRLSKQHSSSFPYSWHG